MVERAIRSVEEQMRTMRSAAEGRLGAWVAWIVEYASFLLNRFEDGHEEKQLMSAAKGRKPKSKAWSFWNRYGGNAGLMKEGLESWQLDGRKEYF